MYDTVIFDLDGVIIDSEIHYCRILYNFLKDRGHPISEADSYRIVGLSVARTRMLMRNWFGESLGESLVNEYMDYLVKKPLDYKEIVCEGVLELIEELKEKHIKLGLASSGRKPNVIRVLKELDIYQKLDFIITGDDVKKSKPSPEIYLKAAKSLETDIKNCVVIEDSHAGIHSAVEAGAYVIAKEETRFDYNQEEANIICKNFDEIRTYMIENLCLFIS